MKPILIIFLFLSFIVRGQVDGDTIHYISSTFIWTPDTAYPQTYKENIVIITILQLWDEYESECKADSILWYKTSEVDTARTNKYQRDNPGFIWGAFFKETKHYRPREVTVQGFLEFLRRKINQLKK